MKIIDISQELFSARVFPGDSPTVPVRVRSMDDGETYNLTELTMCVHNGTHTDAPFHFINDGKTIDEVSLEKYMGECTVVSLDGEITESVIEPVLKSCKPRLLIKGNILITEAAATLMSQKLELIGVEGLTVGPLNAPRAVHLILLGKEVAIIEGLNLDKAKDGEYFLAAQPLKLEGCDGAPCRAVLIEMQIKNPAN